MTQYGIIIEHIYIDLLGDDYKEGIDYKLFRRNSVQLNLWKEVKPRWQEIGRLRQRGWVYTADQETITQIAEILQKGGYRLEDTIAIVGTNEYRGKRYLDPPDYDQSTDFELEQKIRQLFASRTD
ncbi:hypothetical protein HY496_01165 [Candidatus Woesearchaeota archaeon]|nr:hypothetical protein [Candidatus Woesearchaeota archaeon]